MLLLSFVFPGFFVLFCVRTQGGKPAVVVNPSGKLSPSNEAKGGAGGSPGPAVVVNPSGKLSPSNEPKQGTSLGVASVGSPSAKPVTDGKASSVPPQTTPQSPQQSAGVPVSEPARAEVERIPTWLTHIHIVQPRSVC